MEKKDYDFDNRLDYLAYMLNVRTNRKAYENFIVNAIYAKVGDPGLIPVTQQYVKSSNKERPYYLLDLYFPQLNYGIEIDERHHNSKENKEADKVREEDIKAAIQCEEERIPLYTQDDRKRSIEEIESDIDSVVATIKKKITEKEGGVRWVTNTQMKEAVKKRGVFKDTDEADYKGITEIYNICGGRRTGSGSGEATALRKCYITMNSYYKLWVPRLAINENGIVKNTSYGYENYLSEDHNTITEHCVDKQWDQNEKDRDKKFRRVVFMQMRDRFGRRCVKFLGVYQQKGTTTVKAVYERVSKEVPIADLLPDDKLDEQQISRLQATFGIM